MSFSFFQKIFGFKKRVLGIDIGSTTIKVVELTRDLQGRILLENYGFLENYGHLERVNNAFQTSGLKMLEKEVSKILSFLLKKMKVKTKDAVFGVPIYSVLATVLEMPMMPKEDLKKAIPYQAKQFVPFPLSETYLDWFLIKPSEEEIKFRNFNKQLVFLIAYPKDLVLRYQRIAKICNLNLKILELETLALREAMVETDEPIFILDIGSRVTNLVIFDNKFLRVNRFFDLASGDLTEVISSGLKVNIWRAEEFKKRVGLKPSESEREISNLMYPVIDSILREVSKLINLYLAKTGRKVTKLILTGGTASMPGFLEYCQTQFKDLKVRKGNAFLKIFYNKDLEPIIVSLEDSFGVCNGLGLRYLKKF